MCVSWCGEQCTFSKFENLSFLCSVKYYEIWIEILHTGRVQHYLHLGFRIFWNLQMSIQNFRKKACMELELHLWFLINVCTSQVLSKRKRTWQMPLVKVDCITWHIFLQLVEPKFFSYFYFIIDQYKHQQLQIGLVSPQQIKVKIFLLPASNPTFNSR
jgi:hypothetical protein